MLQKRIRLGFFVIAMLSLALLNGSVNAQGSVIALIPIPISYSLVVNPATNTIYASSGSLSGETLAVIDGTSNTISNSIATDIISFRMGVNPNTNRVYLTDLNGNQIIVIDGSNNSILTTIALGNVPHGIAVNPNTNRIYVTEPAAGNLRVIDATTNTVINTIAIGHTLSEIAVNSVTNRIYIADETTYEIVVMDGSDNSIITRIDADGDLNSSPNNMVINDFTNQIYLSIGHPSTFEADIVQIDGDSNLVVDSIPLADSINGLAVNSVINHIYAATANMQDADGKAYIIDGNSNSVIDVLSVGTTPFDIDVNPLTSRVYIVTAYGEVNAQDVAEYAKAAPIHSETRSIKSIASLQSSSGDTIAVIQDILPPLLGPKRNYFRMDTPTLTWSRLDWATAYEIQVDNNSDFKSNEFQDDTISSETLSATTTDLDDGQYYWRVRGKRTNGAWANWSIMQTFAVNA